MQRGVYNLLTSNRAHVCPKEHKMSIFETIGDFYVILATVTFTVALLYYGVQGYIAATKARLAPEPMRIPGVIED